MIESSLKNNTKIKVISLLSAIVTMVICNGYS